MIYAVLQKLIWWTLLLCYRRLYVRGQANIPKDGRVLVAMNHPAGFLEPLSVSGVFHRQLHYLVRGDVFKNKVLAPILRSTNQHPIYRFRDGYEDMKRNLDQIKHIGTVLQQGHPIIVYVEGSTKAVKKLRPLQKGLGRLASSCLDLDSTTPLYILPIGISFTDSTLLHEDVMISVGKPIDARKYIPTLAENKNKGVKELTTETYTALQSELVHINDTTDEALHLNITELSLPHFTKWSPRLAQDSTRIAHHIHIADQLNAMSSDQKSDIAKDVANLRSTLPKGDLRPLAQRDIKWWEIICLIAGFLPAIMGLALHAAPILLARAFVSKKVKEPVFSGALQSVSIMALMIIYYVIGIIVATSVLGAKGILVMLMVAILGLWARRYSFIWRRYKLWYRGRSISKDHLDQAAAILSHFNL